MTGRPAAAPWMQPGAPTTAPLGAHLPRSGASATRHWLARPEPARPALPALPAPSATDPACPRCADRAEADAAAARQAQAADAARAAELAELAAVRARLSAVLASLERARDERADAVTELIVDVALGLCAELAPAAAAMDRRGLGELVRQALSSTGPGEPRVRLRAEDAAILGSQLPAGVGYEIDPTLAPGEVWVDSPRVVVDGRWPTRLAALREPLIAMLRAAEPALELATPEPAEDRDAG